MQKEGTADLGVTLSMVPAKGTVNAGQLVQQYHLVHSRTAQQPAPEHGRDNCGRQHISVVLAPDPWDLGLLPVLGICILCPQMAQGQNAL